MCKMTKTQRLELNGRGRLPSAMQIDSQSTATSGPEFSRRESTIVENYLPFMDFQANWNKAPVPS